MKITLPTSASRADTAPAAGATASAALAGLASRWRTLLRQFNQRNERERLLLIAAGIALVCTLADQLWLGPALQAYKAAQGAQATAQQLQQGLQADIAQLETRGVAHARQQQAELAQWRQRLQDGDAGLRRHEDSLVGPERMVDLLEQLLARHGEVRVRALRSLGRSDLLSGGTAKAPAATASAPGPTPGTGGLYRHGVELVLEGGYTDLLGYLQAMEALPQRVLWGGVTLKVEQHPRSVLTVRVYTLSRDPHWLEI